MTQSALTQFICKSEQKNALWIFHQHAQNLAAAYKAAVFLIALFDSRIKDDYLKLLWGVTEARSVNKNRRFREGAVLLWLYTIFVWVAEVRNTDNWLTSVPAILSQFGASFTIAEDCGSD